MLQSFVKITFEILKVTKHFKPQNILNLISTKLLNVLSYIFLE